MANLIDAYGRRVDPYLRKTGGDTLFRDPVLAMEAATKQYVDNATSAVQVPNKVFPSSGGVGNWFGPTTAFGQRTTSSIPSFGGFDSKVAISPMFVGSGTRTWDRIGFRGAFSSSPGTPPPVYLCVYTLDPTTLLPTSSALVWVNIATIDATQRWYFVSISLTTTSQWLGVGAGSDQLSGETSSITSLSCGTGALNSNDVIPYSPYGIVIPTASGSAVQATPVNSLIARYGNGSAPSTPFSASVLANGPPASDFKVCNNNTASASGGASHATTVDWENGDGPFFIRGVYLRLAS